MTFPLVNIFFAAILLLTQPCLAQNEAAAPAGEQAAPAAVEAEAPTAEPAKPTLGEKVLEQVAELEVLEDEVKKLNSAIKAARDEEQAVLRDQQRRKQAEIRDGLKVLVKGIVELESNGEDASEIRKKASEITTTTSTWLRTAITDSLKLLTDLDERVKSASDAEMPDLRSQIAAERQAVDKELGALLENSDRMELLGINNKGDLKYLDETLVQRADILVARMQYLVDQRSAMKKQVTGASEDEKKLLKDKIYSMDGRISSTAANLKITIELMNERGIEATDYKQILIASTGEITKDIFESEVALGLMQQWLEIGKEWLLREGPKWAFKLIIFFSILFFFYLLGKSARFLFASVLTSSRLKTSALLRELFIAMIGKLIFLIGILIALAQIGIQIAPLLAGLGIAGFIIGFALQETLSNFAAGVMILIYQPFDVGDTIEAGGVNGKVRHMSLVSTTITTFDNQRVIVPNSKIWGDVIRNVNAEEMRRVDMVFGIGYEDDIAHAERVLHEIVEGHPLVLKDPAPIINLHALSESSVDFIVRPWVKSGDYWDVYWDITKSVKQRFDEEGLSIPFPQQDMHVYHHGNGSADGFGKI